MRNVRKAVKASERKPVVVGLRAVYEAPHSVEGDLGPLLAFFDCPEQHREYVRTSNPIERAFRELRRQTFGCGAFANREACNRAVYRVYSWLNDRWSGSDICHRRLTNPQNAGVKVPSS